MLHKAWNSKEEMPYCFPRTFIKFEGHTGQNITDFDPNWAFPDYRPVAAFKSLRFALFLNNRNSIYMLNIMFIFNRCQHRLAAVTSVKYECGSKDFFQIILQQIKNWPQQNLINEIEASVTPPMTMWARSRPMREDVRMNIHVID